MSKAMLILPIHLEHSISAILRLNMREVNRTIWSMSSCWSCTHGHSNLANSKLHHTSRANMETHPDILRRSSSIWAERLVPSLDVTIWCSTYPNPQNCTQNLHTLGHQLLARALSIWPNVRSCYRSPALQTALWKVRCRGLHRLLRFCIVRFGLMLVQLNLRIIPGLLLLH